MALRAAATARPPISPIPSPIAPPPKPFFLTKFSPKTQAKPITLSLPTSATLSLFSLFVSVQNATALNLPKEQIVSSITQAQETIDQVEQVGSSVFDVIGKTVGAVIDAVKPGVDVAMPILQKAGGEAVKIASPVVSDASKKAQEAIMQSSGFNMETAAKTVADAAQQTSKVIEVAKPIASSTAETIASTDPVVLVGTGGVLFVAYLLLPAAWSAISFNFRGFKGGLTPAQTLDLISTKNYILIDIRSEKDKDKAGIPRLPSSAKNKMISIPLEELPSKLKGLVRDTKKLEAEIAALKISYLKKINKGSNIVILGTYSDSAKIVARVLTSLGFQNSWIVTDGFSGSKGWLQSRLGTDSYNFSFAEVLSPSRIIPARRFGTTTSAKLLSD